MISSVCPASSLPRQKDATPFTPSFTPQTSLIWLHPPEKMLCLRSPITSWDSSVLTSGFCSSETCLSLTLCLVFDNSVLLLPLQQSPLLINFPHLNPYLLFIPKVPVLVLFSSSFIQFSEASELICLSGITKTAS